MERTKYPLSHEWHVAVNRHQDAQRAAGKEWGEARFMYEAMHMADDCPRTLDVERAGRVPEDAQRGVNRRRALM